MSGMHVSQAGAPRPRGAGARWGLGLSGALIAATGLALIVWPFLAASWLLAVFFGTALIASGLAVLVRGGGRGPAIVGGLMLAAVGLFALLFPTLTSGAFIAFGAFLFITIGVLWLIIASRVGARITGLVPGIVLLVGGILALIWPDVALAVVATIAGLVFTLIGVSTVWMAIRLGRPPRDDAAETIILIDPDAGPRRDSAR